jgi:hypothetical protein
MNNILETIRCDEQPYLDGCEITSELIIKNNSDTIIISFGGCLQHFKDKQTFEFLNFLNVNFPSYDKYFYIDKKFKWYNSGISGISSNIDQTIVYLKNIIKNYKEVIFLGTSAGGYASILFGSLLNVNKVLAFIPQTIIKGDDLDPLYKDLNNVINKTTNYYLYGDVNISNKKDLHHINHCYNIGHHKNVSLVSKQGIDLKEMRDNGELLEIFNDLFKCK